MLASTAKAKDQMNRNYSKRDRVWVEEVHLKDRRKMEALMVRMGSSRSNVRNEVGEFQKIPFALA